MTPPGWLHRRHSPSASAASAGRQRTIRLAAWLIGFTVLSHSPVVTADRSENDALDEAAEAITSLDVGRAAELLQKLRSEGPRASFERARLAIYRGDCRSARAILSTPTFAGRKEPEQLLDIAERCVGALIDAVEVRDEAHGVWLRIQDEKDRVLAPFIAEVASRARDAMKRELGVALPVPLRIDLVRDNFSLSGVTGLPLKATETTGTVAVARWGRVAMISPRAAPEGYPWQDTLAHEIVHLALTQATGDHAPLWLQEGLAKLNEAAWRSPRAFDGLPNPDRVAADALASGTSVGVDSIGPSVAMLPSPELASIAYAEVESFTRFWISENGKAALELLLRDLRGLKPPNVDPAMVSVTGYPLKTWIGRWQKYLRATPVTDGNRDTIRSQPSRGLAAAVRMGDLLAGRSHSSQAAVEFELADSESPGHPAIRWRLARSLLLAESPDLARERLGRLDDLPGLHAGWLAMRATLLENPNLADGALRDSDYAVAVGLHPYLEEAACRGLILEPPRTEAPLPEQTAAELPPASAGEPTWGPGRASSAPGRVPRVPAPPTEVPGAEPGTEGGVSEDEWARLCGAARRFPSD